MKVFRMCPNLVGIIACSSALLLCGCAGPRTVIQSENSNGISYRKDPHLQKVWLAEGFDFRGFDAVYVAPTLSEALPSKNSEEAEMLDWAKRFLHDEFVHVLKVNKDFVSVVSNANEIGQDKKLLKMENTIIEHAKGSGAARFWAGEFGAGQPLIRVRGKMSDGDRVVFRFESYRKGDSATARLDPGWTPEKVLQSMDISDLAKDMSDFISRTARHLPPK